MTAETTTIHIMALPARLDHSKGGGWEVAKAIQLRHCSHHRTTLLWVRDSQR